MCRDKDKSKDKRERDGEGRGEIEEIFREREIDTYVQR